ncbi:hypothetical protein HDV05_004108 [Chytridiales sp. JEL 0842]|nr:hypothetical protein HDV05_004108 [Chytridiales sp. JEL 0842]
MSTFFESETPLTSRPASSSTRTRPTSATSTASTPHTPRSTSATTSTPTSAVLEAISASPLLSAAIVKEYLTSKGLTRSLEAFRLEHLQFQPPTVSSRQDLARQLGISKLVVQNKSADQPLKTFLELIVKHLLTKREGGKGGEGGKAQMANLLESLTNPKNEDEGKERGGLLGFKTPLGEFGSGNPRSVSARSERSEYGVMSTKGVRGDVKKMNVKSVEASKRGSVVSKKVEEGEEAVAAQGEYATPVFQPVRQTSSDLFIKSDRVSTTPNATTTTTTTDSDAKGLSNFFTPKNVSVPSSATPTRKPVTTNCNDIQITEDFDSASDSDDEFYPTPVLPNNKTNTGSSIGNLQFVSKGTLISTSKALALRRVTFPGPTEDARGRSTFTDEWRGKGFVFNTVPQLGYGLVQSKGGPCGLLAGVQAFVVKWLAFGGKYTGAVRGDKLRPTSSQSVSALIDAIAEILWQAGGTRHRRAVVALYKPNLRVQANVNPSHEKYIPDGITENMELHEFVELAMLREFINFNIDSFLGNDPGRHGLIQVLYSAVLSRGADVVRDEDFDYRECSLIGRHGYCTQEMVNLLTVGQAISNVHDGDIVLSGSSGTDGEDSSLLKGIKRPCQFGFLTLFEHYGSMKVGEYLKTPHLPIFVVCSESHFTVLFSTDRELLNKAAQKSVKNFDLVYYDQLAGQDAEIRLTIYPFGNSHSLGGGLDGGHVSGGGGRKSMKKKEDDLIPPLDLVLRTKWSGCEVDWNGTEPLL